MTKCLSLLTAALFLPVAAATCAQTRAASGIVVSSDKPHSSLVISCDPVPGYMSAMEMSFAVSDKKLLATLSPGTSVHFTIVPRGRLFYAEDVQAVSGGSFESEPMEASGMTALQDALDPASEATVVKQGHLVPDFALTDQAGHEIHLNDLRGKVVVLTFGYSRCPNPQYCFRLSDNLAHVERRFKQVAGSQLVLVTIAIDPEHDQGEQLREYAAVWHADAAKWHFLTGPLPQVKQVAAMFNMNFWRRGGLLMHSLHTVVIGRDGRLVANLEGNQFTARQLGDLAQTALSQKE